MFISLVNMDKVTLGENTGKGLSGKIKLQRESERVFTL